MLRAKPLFTFERRYTLSSGLWVDLLLHPDFGYFWQLTRCSSNRYLTLADSDGFFFDRALDALLDARAVVLELGYRRGVSS
jgi:hypothetical protein